MAKIQEARVGQFSGEKASFELVLEGGGIVDFTVSLRDIPTSNGQRSQPQPQTKTVTTGAPKCPKCGSEMRERTSSRGRFWGCTKYPNCKSIVNIG